MAYRQEYRLRSRNLLASFLVCAVVPGIGCAGQALWEGSKALEAENWALAHYDDCYEELFHEMKEGPEGSLEPSLLVVVEFQECEQERLIVVREFDKDTIRVDAAYVEENSIQTYLRRGYKVDVQADPDAVCSQIPVHREVKDLTGDHLAVQDIANLHQLLVSAIPPDELYLHAPWLNMEIRTPFSTTQIELSVPLDENGRVGSGAHPLALWVEDLIDDLGLNCAELMRSGNRNKAISEGL